MSKFIKNKKELMLVLLFICSAILAASIFVKFVDFFVASAKAKQLVKEAADRGRVEASEIDKFLADSKKLAEELKKKNLFVQPLQKVNPVKAVMAIFGKEVFIDGQWYKAGDKVGDAEIVSIGPAQVKIKWNGSVKTFAPISVVSAEKPKTTDEKKAQEVVSKEKMAEKAVAKAVQTENQAAEQIEQKEDSLAWMGLELTDSQREKLELIFSRMPDKYKEQMKQQWNNMSDEQKQEGLAEIDRMSMGEMERQLDEMNSRI